MAKHSKPNNVGKKRTTAQIRLNEYNEEQKQAAEDLGHPLQHAVPFRKWLRGKFGVTVEERHGGKAPEIKVGKPYQRVQHRRTQGGL